MNITYEDIKQMSTKEFTAYCENRLAELQPNRQSKKDFNECKLLVKLINKLL